MSTALLDQPGAVRDENGFDPRRILSFLNRHIPDLADGLIHKSPLEPALSLPPDCLPTASYQSNRTAPCPPNFSTSAAASP